MRRETAMKLLENGQKSLKAPGTFWSAGEDWGNFQCLEMVPDEGNTTFFFFRVSFFSGKNILTHIYQAFWTLNAASIRSHDRAPSKFVAFFKVCFYMCVSESHSICNNICATRGKSVTQHGLKNILFTRVADKVRIWGDAYTGRCPRWNNSTIPSKLTNCNPSCSSFSFTFSKTLKLGVGPSNEAPGVFRWLSLSLSGRRWLHETWNRDESAWKRPGVFGGPRNFLECWGRLGKFPVPIDGARRRQCYVFLQSSFFLGNISTYIYIYIYIDFVWTLNVKSTVEQFNYSFGTNKSRPVMQQFFGSLFQRLWNHVHQSLGVGLPKKHLGSFWWFSLSLSGRRWLHETWNLDESIWKQPEGPEFLECWERLEKFPVPIDGARVRHYHVFLHIFSFLTSILTYIL